MREYSKMFKAYRVIASFSSYQFGDKNWHKKVRTSAIADILLCLAQCIISSVFYFFFILYCCYIVTE